uniref:C-type lectin domain-containing protein n=1 Tax=Ditylenchus dipsaci TaxID=166011 RepID=A0A915DPY0_9BILA
MIRNYLHSLAAILLCAYYTGKAIIMLEIFYILPNLIPTIVDLATTLFQFMIPKLQSNCFVRLRPGALSIILGIQKIEGKWRWLDETPLDYTNWESSKIAQDASDNSCAYLYEGSAGMISQWAVFNCSEYVPGPVSLGCFFKDI